MLGSRTHALLFFFFVAAAAGCTESTPIGGGAGGGTTTGTGQGGDITTGVGGAGGGSSTASGTGGGASTGTGVTCYGDAAEWAAITATPIACTKNSDCCVVVNGCTNQAQVVAAGDFAAAPGAWPYCDDECTDCIPPVVDVGCVDGVCVGEALPPDGQFGTSHCGEDVTTLDPLNPAQTFSCGGG